MSCIGIVTKHGSDDVGDDDSNDDDRNDDNDDDRDGKSSSFLKFQLTCRAPLPARPPIQTSARFYSRDRRLFLQNPQFLTQILNQTVIFETPTILTWRGREDSSSKLPQDAP